MSEFINMARCNYLTSIQGMYSMQLYSPPARKIFVLELDVVRCTYEPAYTPRDLFSASNCMILNVYT